MKSYCWFIRMNRLWWMGYNFKVGYTWVSQLVMNYKREIKALELLRHQFIWIFNHPALSSVQSSPLSHRLVSWHFTVVIAKHVLRLVLIFMRHTIGKFIVHLNLIKFNVHLKQSSRKYRPLKPETPKPPIHKPYSIW